MKPVVEYIPQALLDMRRMIETQLDEARTRLLAEEKEVIRLEGALDGAQTAITLLSNSEPAAPAPPMAECPDPASSVPHRGRGRPPGQASRQRRDIRGEVLDKLLRWPAAGGATEHNIANAVGGILPKQALVAVQYHVKHGRVVEVSPGRWLHVNSPIRHGGAPADSFDAGGNGVTNSPDDDPQSDDAPSVAAVGRLEE